MAGMGFYLLMCFYFMIPGMAANMAPVLVKDILKSLAIPVDMGKKIGKKRIFGDNKTIRGVISGILFSLIFIYIQSLLYRYPAFNALSFFDYSSKWFPAGLLFGSGVMVGDLTNSFIKRRVGLRPGRSFIPFDQINAAIGGLIFISPIYLPHPLTFITVIILSFCLHIGFNLLGYYLRLKKTKL